MPSLSATSFWVRPAAFRASAISLPMPFLLMFIDYQLVVYQSIPISVEALLRICGRLQHTPFAPLYIVRMAKIENLLVEADCPYCHNHIQETVGRLRLPYFCSGCGTRVRIEETADVPVESITKPIITVESVRGVEREQVGLCEYAGDSWYGKKTKRLTVQVTQPRPTQRPLR
jgi:hypothetical protein